ncbi:MAG: DUF1957 domain-containing protein [Candidatus Omnitrophica bacterium]|nr:DUF1957 domain-containing protein [Candidatus Omnitrophota bacterium]
MNKGYICLMLHAHLPFVRHPERDDVLEENWLYEAITETYIPLINVFEHLVNDGINFRVTMSMTPPLISMLKDPLLQERYVNHLDKLIELSEKELDKTGHEPHFHGLALMYYRKFREAKEIFVDRYEMDIVDAFKEFQEIGCLEIITCGATHGFFPIIGVNEHSVRAQVEIAVEQYKRVFSRAPRGIWLPECGFKPGVEEFLKNAGIKFFFVDTHAIMHADPAPRYNVYAPLFTPAGVAAFARDEESSKQVWSSKEGYPGDPDYREYYKDIGYERDFEYIKPYIHPEGIRINTGMKYWRITGESDYKEAYRPDWAQDKAAMHAQDFINNRQKQVDYLCRFMDRKPIVVAPYDAELFGHWWYEGPMWIDFLARKIACDQDQLQMITPSEYLAEYPTNQVAMPTQSSWGYKGFSEYWLNDTNQWVYPHLDVASKRMKELVDKFLNPWLMDPLFRRVLNQAARELLLAESSDWTFIMRTGTMVPYAEKRVRQHIGRFTKLYNDLMQGKIDIDWLEEIEDRDNIFNDLDCAKYYLENHQDFTRQFKRAVINQSKVMK